jgi:hypothetical protein
MVNDPANFVDPDGRLGVAVVSMAWCGQYGAVVTVANTVSTVSQGLSVMGGIMNFVSTCAGIVAGLRGLITVGDFVSNVSINKGISKSNLNMTTREYEQLIGNSGVSGTDMAASDGEWHEENGEIVSDEGDQIYTLMDYAAKNLKLEIELNKDLWNNGNYKGTGMHSYELYNIFKQYGGKDAMLRYGEVRIPKDRIINETGTNENKYFGSNNYWIGPTLIGLGQPIKWLKPVGALSSSPGSSIASFTLSKTFPYRSPVIKKTTTLLFGRTSSTAVLGRAMGRSVPVLGWGILAFDIWNNRETINEFILIQREMNEVNRQDLIWHVR